jgi:ribonuclease BN (tRNA processing enzyme)
VAPRLLFLGTGGGAHVERCHAALALQLTPQRVLLLDTAGGFEVVRQLRRAGVDLETVTRIFLTHRHSDHLAGLEPLLLHAGLEAMHRGGRAADVAVYGHPDVLGAARTVLVAMASIGEQLLAGAGVRLDWLPLCPGAPVDLWPGVQLTAFPADHIPEDGTALGCAVAWEEDGRRRCLVYSGDSRPTAALRRYARGADVLIHEAGGVDAQKDLVWRSGHSTAGEAARQAAAAGVGRLFLCHVPHDGAVPFLLDEARRHFRGPVAIPDDLDAYDLE